MSKPKRNRMPGAMPLPVKAGPMIRESLEQRLGIRQAPVMCPECGREMLIVSYVLLRPEEAECSIRNGGCGATWKDDTDYGRLCLKCGYGESHKEGLGCMNPVSTQPPKPRWKPRVVSPTKRTVRPVPKPSQKRGPKPGRKP